MSICQIYDLCAETLWLGRYNENGARDIAIDVGKWFADLGTEGTVVLVNWRPGEDDSPYNPNITMDGSKVVWSPNNIDLAISGRGFAELRYYVGNVLAKSKTFRTVIDRTPSEGANPPSASEDWVERMEQAAVDAVEASASAMAAEESAVEAAETAANAKDVAVQAANTATSSEQIVNAKAAEVLQMTAQAVETADEATSAAQTATEQATAAATSETNAAGSAESAAASAGAAGESAAAAASSALTAQTAGQTATAKAQEATEAATEAKASETAAKASETNAAQSATAASGAQTVAEAARAAAQAARTGAETARTGAESARSGAETAQAAAEQAAASVTASAEQIETNRQDISDVKADLSESVSDLKSALKAGFEYIGLNLVGMDTTKLYPVRLPAGSSVTISTADGLPTPVAIRLEFYDANKTMKEWYPLQANKASRTIALSANLGDIAYLRLYNVKSQNIMVAYGSAVQPYAPYDSGYPALAEIVKSHTNSISNLETLTGEVHGEEVNSWSNLPDVGTGYITPNGVVHASEYFALSDYVPVMPGDTVVYNNINCNIGGGTMMAVACYDYNKNYIANAGVSGSTSGVSGTYTLPDNVHYIRVGDYITKRGSYHFTVAMLQKDAIEALMADHNSTNLSNLKIAMIGDSTYAITGGGSASNQRINDYLADLSNAVVSNFAIGGTLMTDLRTTDTWKYYDFVRLMTAKINGDMSEQLSDANLSGKPGYIRTVVTDLNAADLSTYDVLLINYGTNDYASEAPITGDNPYAVNTLSGALRTMIERIGTAYPNLKIVFNTPYWRCWTNPSNYVNDAFTRENGLNLKMKDYIDAINNIASGEYGLPVINNLFENGWNRYNMNTYFDSNDGTHFNIAGAKFVARKTYEFLSRQGFALGRLDEQA